MNRHWAGASHGAPVPHGNSPIGPSAALRRERRSGLPPRVAPRCAGRITGSRRRRRWLSAALVATAAAGGLAACHQDLGPAACFDPDASAYAFSLNGDATLVFHWPASYMPVRVYAEPTGTLRSNVAMAMALWTGAFRCGELSLTWTSDSTRADIIVRNPLTIPALRLPDARLLHSDSVGACTGVTELALDSAGTALAGPMRSFVSPLPGHDSAAVASCYHFVVAHELGHALGLLAESPDTGDLMYQTPDRFALTLADRYTIQLLYHTTATIGPERRP
jgi:hypothetical protein